jgi:hypothetical protein
MQGDVNDLYEFVAIGTNQPTSSFFETCMYKAMWERKYNHSAEEASDKDLKQFIYGWAESRMQNVYMIHRGTQEYKNQWIPNSRYFLILQPLSQRALRLPLLRLEPEASWPIQKKQFRKSRAWRMPFSPNTLKYTAGTKIRPSLSGKANAKPTLLNLSHINVGSCSLIPWDCELIFVF